MKKKTNKILKIILFILLFIIVILIIDYARIDFRYFISKKNYEETFPIKGPDDGYTPQGITYSDIYNVVLESAYKTDDAAKIYVIDFSTGNDIKSIDLYLSDGKKNTTHAGGIATDNKTVWVTGDGMVYEYSLKDIVETKDNKIQSNKEYKLLNNGDFCYYKNLTLWIGDFFLKPLYPVPNDNPLLYGYEKNEKSKIEYESPVIALTLPKMVQGMSITDDNEFLFTASFTNLINSTLYKYKDIREDADEKIEINGSAIDYSTFTKEDIISTTKLPPMAEGMFYYKDDVYITFENTAKKYFFAFPKVRKVLKLNINKKED